MVPQSTLRIKRFHCAGDVEGRRVWMVSLASQAVMEQPHNDAMTDREAAWDAVHEALPAGLDSRPAEI